MPVEIDLQTLFLTLLTVALLQEFAIKPSVEFIKKYYHKSRSHLKKIIKKEDKKNGKENTATASDISSQTKLF